MALLLPAAKRWLLRLHRWLGVALWLVFLSWFTSGLVMMYAGYPELTSAGQLLLLAPLDLERCCVSLDSAVRAARLGPRLRQARIEMLLDRPIYRLEDDSRRRAFVYADDGTPSNGVTLAIATQIAMRAARGAAMTPPVSILREPDQWVLEVAHTELPLARFAFDDAAATHLYVSLNSGEVVQLVTRRQRLLAWVGAIPHWIYPASLRRHRDGWRYLVLALATLGALGCLSGLTLGIWRARLRRGVVWLRSPFVDQWMRWHHYLGLTFGLFAFTWVFSGLLSLNPFDWSPGGAPSLAEVDALAGGTIEPGTVSLPPREAWKGLRLTMAARTLELARVGGKLFYVATESASVTRLLAADGTTTPSRDRLDRDELLEAFRPVAHGAPITEVNELSSYDDYYYARSADRALPVLRIVLADREKPWYYLDVHTGRIAFKSTSRSRVERWLYHGLHSLDFKLLMRHPPLWDIVVILLSLGGIALSGTGAVLAVRWLRSS